MRTPTFIPLASTIALAAALGLAACGKTQGDRSVGEKIDSAVAKVEQKSEQASTEVKKDIEAARVNAGKTIDAASAKVKDAAITTGVNAELARDASLSVLKINVDTNEGRVVLRGTAPDAASRDRATQLAQRIDGVAGVENQLQIKN